MMHNKQIPLETWHSPGGRLRNQIHHCLIDGWYHSEVIEVKAWELEAALLGVSEPELLSLHDKRKNTIGYTREQTEQEWFDEECELVNEEKNACRANAIQKWTRTAYNKYRQTIERDQKRGNCLESSQGYLTRRL
jgi:hypothetical protein